MSTTTTAAGTVGTGAWADLSVLAARLSQADGDGHHWDEDDARRWLRRMGFAPAEDGGHAGAYPDDSRAPEQIQNAG